MVWSMYPWIAGCIPPLSACSRLAMPTRRSWVCGRGRAPAACRFFRRRTPSCRMRPRMKRPGAFFKPWPWNSEWTPDKRRPALSYGMFTPAICISRGGRSTTPSTSGRPSSMTTDVRISKASTRSTVSLRGLRGTISPLMSGESISMRQGARLILNPFKSCFHKLTALP